MLKNSSELQRHLQELRDRFLPNSAQLELDTPEAFEASLEARAYSVLAHSAFEQFFEDTAIDFATAVVNQWQAGGPISRQSAIAIACMTATLGDLAKVLDTSRKKPSTTIQRKDHSDISTDPSTSLSTSPQEVIPSDLAVTSGTERSRTGPAIDPRVVLGDLLRKFGSQYRVTVVDENHGTDIFYLRSVYLPIGIKIDPPPEARSAISHIANARGTFAHRRTALRDGKFAYKPIQAAKVLDATEQLCTWCKEFEDELSNSLRIPVSDLFREAKKELLESLTDLIRRIATRRS